MGSVVLAASRYAKSRLAWPLVVTVAMAGAIGTFIADANAASLTPEQQAIVKKYNISKADQEKLFGADTADAADSGSQPEVAAFQEQAAPETPRGPVARLLAGTYVWAGAETYKSIGDRLTNINGGTGSLTGSFGAVGGFNSGFTLTESNIGLQAGASYGVYDFKGRLRIVPDAFATERQAFYTGGIYKRGNMAKDDASLLDRLSLGVVYDAFKAERWGINANDISLSQVRGTVGFALNRSTEIGAWGTYGLDSDMAAVTVAGAPGVRRKIRAMNQANIYLKHNFDFGGEIMGYAGTLDSDDIGDWQVGLVGRVPLSNNWSTYASANYVVPNSHSGPNGSGEEQFSASFGLSYYFGGNAASSTVTGNRELPLLDVASNRTFLITD